MQSEKPIGIFDAGPGGLAVLLFLMKHLPAENVIYLADTARHPYGPLERNIVEQYTIEACRYLINRGVKAILIGCNTASIAGLKAVNTLFPQIPIFGMIEPGVRAALREKTCTNIGVWGTELTVASHAYRDAILGIDPTKKVAEVACVDLLRLAEKGRIQNKGEILELCRRYLEPFEAINMDMLIFGCTDLTCVRAETALLVGSEVKIIDPADEIVLSIKERLSAENNLNSQDQENRSFDIGITGDDQTSFKQFAEDFLDLRPLNVGKVTLI